MIMNILFGWVPHLIGSVLGLSLIAVFCNMWVNNRVAGVDDITGDGDRKELDDRVSKFRRTLKRGLLQSFILYAIVSFIYVWNTYGYRVTANPFSNNVAPYEPVKQDVEPAKPFIEIEDRRGRFNENLKDKPTLMVNDDTVE